MKKRPDKKIIMIITIILYVIIMACLITALVFSIRSIRKQMESDNTQESTEEETITQETLVVENESAISDLRDALNETDMSAKIELLERAAYDYGDDSLSDAMYFLGEIYLQGIGVESDHEVAAAYFSDACQKGNTKAFLPYAKMLFMGDGVELNYDEAASYFYSLTNDDGQACYVYAVMANLGMGMPRSIFRANEFVVKAVQLGYADANAYVAYIQDLGQAPTYMFDYYAPAKDIRTPSYGAENEDLADMVDAYYEELKSTESFDAFDAELEALMQVDMTGVNSLAYFGNGGYMFHMNQNDGDSIQDFLSNEYYTEDELKAIADNLTKQKEYVESKGSQFVLVLIPNKENIYSEYMPRYISNSRSSDLTKQDKLVDYLKSNTDIDIVYTKDTLLEKKDDYQVYYKTDTHLNMVGTLFVLSDMLENMFGKSIDVNIDEFQVHMDNYLGDLGSMVNAPEQIGTDSVYFYADTSVSDSDKLDKSMLLVGDSFSEFLNMEATYYFTGGVDHRMVADFDYDYEAAMEAGLADSTPDYVVWEIVERQLDRLK